MAQDWKGLRGGYKQPKTSFTEDQWPQWSKMSAQNLEDTSQNLFTLLLSGKWYRGICFLHQTTEQLYSPGFPETLKLETSRQSRDPLGPFRFGPNARLLIELVLTSL